MTDDDLRARLARRDPVRRSEVAAFLARPTDLRERAMQTVENDTDRPRPLLATVAVAATVAVVVGGAVLAARPDSGGSAGPAKAPTTMALSLPDPLAMSSCVMFDVAILREMPVAFSATATDVTAGQVTLDVDHWYQGGDADVVTLTTPGEHTSASLDGVDFAAGGHYLVTATDGHVNGCGFSGPSSAELEGAFEEAFGG